MASFTTQFPPSSYSSSRNAEGEGSALALTSTASSGWPRGRREDCACTCGAQCAPVRPLAALGKAGPAGLRGGRRPEEPK